MSIPEFSSYGGLDCMDLEQIEFYRNLEKSINSKDFIDVAGNVSYLFVYVKNCLYVCSAVIKIYLSNFQK